MASTAHAIKSLSKFGEVTTERNQHSIQIGRYVVSFIDQNGSAICINVRRETDHTDLQSDYFAGSWATNITQAIRWATTWK